MIDQQKWWVVFGLLLGLALPTYGQQATINGFVRDASTGEPLPYANVVLKDTQQGGATDLHGYYVISNIPVGAHTLLVSMLGYARLELTIEVKARGANRFDAELAPEAIETEALVVTAERQRFTNDVEVSRVNIRPADIRNTPAFIEADVFRSVQQLPSVTSQNDFSTALIVRGGRPDENLITLDGAEIYNPFHLGGVFSTFNADAIADAEFLAGGYAAEHTGRLSSVLNITSREGNSKGGRLFKDKKAGTYWDLSRITTDISLLSSKALAEGPFYKGAWLLSGRRTYFDVLADAINRGRTWDYFFWDTQFKVFSDLSPQHRLTFSSFNGRDLLAFKLNQDDAFGERVDFDWEWGNNSSSFQWRYIPSARVLSELTVTRSRFDFDLDVGFIDVDSTSSTQSETNFVALNNIRDLTITEKLTWFASPQHTFTVGASFKTLDMEFVFEQDNIRFFDLREKPHVISAFVQDEWRVNERLRLQVGLRGSKYRLHDQLYLAPRVAFKYMMHSNLSVKGSWGIFNQFLFTTNEEDEILRIVDFWQAIPKDFDALRNQHVILGLERWFGQGFTGSVEGYYKPYSNVFTNNPSNLPGVEGDEFISGTGRVWGLEFLLKKTSGNLTGWVGYAYTHSQRRFDLNGDEQVQRTDNAASEIYTPFHAKPHTFNLVASYRANARHRLSVSLTASSGQPYTPVVGKVFDGGDYLADPFDSLINIEGERNSARYPFYFRTDLGWIHDLSLFGLNGELNVSVMNVTNRFNVLLYQWDHDASASQVNAVGMFPVIPSIGLKLHL